MHSDLFRSDGTNLFEFKVRLWYTQVGFLLGPRGFLAGVERKGRRWLIGIGRF